MLLLEAGRHLRRGRALCRRRAPVHPGVGSREFDGGSGGFGRGSRGGGGTGGNAEACWGGIAPQGCVGWHRLSPREGSKPSSHGGGPGRVGQGYVPLPPPSRCRPGLVSGLKGWVVGGGGAVGGGAAVWREEMRTVARRVETPPPPYSRHLPLPVRPPPHRPPPTDHPLPPPPRFEALQLRTDGPKARRRRVVRRRSPLAHHHQRLTRLIAALLRLLLLA